PAGAHRLVQHALVERQPGDLAVHVEARVLEVDCWRGRLARRGRRMGLVGRGLRAGRRRGGLGRGGGRGLRGGCRGAGHGRLAGSERLLRPRRPGCLDCVTASGSRGWAGRTARGHAISAQPVVPRADNCGMQGKKSPAMDSIVGDDPDLRAVLARAALVAPTATPVLVTGESGTGKEALARALHELGASPDGPFVAVNCGALPRELAESELFGHERGAFTGAAGRRRGWFEEASGGTLVLDEVGELPLGLQPKLLRVLETGRIRRVGGVGESAVAVRVVAMTLRNLKAEHQRGTFRGDLYYRLAGFELTLPPLRRRRGDIPALVRHFLRELEPELGQREIEAAALDALTQAEWPGNIREL